MDLMRRRREMMMAALENDSWDYIFTPQADGYYSALPVTVYTGQTVIIEFASSTNNNGYIYYCSQGGVISPNSQRTNTVALKEGGTFTRQITGDGTLYFGTNKSGSQYYNFNGEYIKVRIE